MQKQTNVHLEMKNLKQTELQDRRTEEKKRLKIRAKMIEQEGETKKYKRKRKDLSEIENHEKPRLNTLKRLKRGDENELQRKLRLKKVVATHQGGRDPTIKVGRGDRRRKEEQDWRMMQLPNGSVWPWIRTKKEKQD